MMEAFALRRVCIPVDDIAAATAGRPPRILLVSGDANLRAAATRCLQDTGYAVIAAAHSGHALLACLTSGPVDVLVSELAMEETSGPALAQRIRRNHPHLRTVYLARAGTPERPGLIALPLTRDALVGAIEHALSGSNTTSSPA